MRPSTRILCVDNRKLDKMFRTDLLCYFACTSVAVASAFTPTPLGLKPGLLPSGREGIAKSHSLSTRIPKRIVGLRMQQEQTESASALAIEEKPEAAAESVKTVKAVENKIGVAIRTRGDTKVQTEPEVNYFARVMSSHRAQHLWLAFCVAPSWFLILALSCRSLCALASSRNPVHFSPLKWLETRDSTRSILLKETIFFSRLETLSASQKTRAITF